MAECMTQPRIIIVGGGFGGLARQGAIPSPGAANVPREPKLHGVITVTTNSPTFAHQIRCEAQFAQLAISLNR
jgi:hypothetical protein